MGYLTSLYLPGALAMWCALLFAVASLWGYSLVLRGDAAALGFARRAYNFFALSVVLGGVVLAFALLTRDFRIEYVWQYSGLELPAHYQLAAFWAGQKGSFLIWLLWGSLLGTLLYRSAGRRQEPMVMTVYLLTVLGLLFILVRENPFVMLAETPTDGKGLNPLLQDDWMVIHPPIMFIGYAASAIPFAFAMAALWRRDTSGGWARRAFPWALGGFLVLGLAILLGGYWAYKTLGWGGYWGWDPVENASLIPFVFGTVLIHGLYIERTRGRFRRANFVFATLVYLSVLYGTFLTRSGVLADFSVHSFVDLGISAWLIGLMVVFGLGSIWLLATRLREIPTRPNEDPLVSRGTALVLAAIALLASALVITFGTSAPLLTAFLENPGQVGPEFYNRVNLPIALLIALLLAVVPFLTWRGGPGREILRKTVPSFVAAIGVAVVAAVAGVHNPFFLLYFFLAALAMGTNLHKTVLKAFPGELPAGTPLRTRIRAWGSGLSRAGGYLAHVGVGIILIGFLASSGYDRSTKLTLPLDQPREVGGRTLTFVGFLEKTSPRDKDAMVVEVAEADGSKFYSYPKLFRNERSGQMMANPHVRSSPLADFYVSPLEYQPGEPAGQARSVTLAANETVEVGPYSLRFEGLSPEAVERQVVTAMSTGSPMLIAFPLVLVDRETGAEARVTPARRWDLQRQVVEQPPEPLPGGGQVVVTAFDPSSQELTLRFAGAPGFESAGRAPSLAVDVTEKPLIQLVWFGLWVILLGGFLAVASRLRQALKPLPDAEQLPVADGPSRAP